jgi:DNA-binding beta-propeller fold protein YncE
VTAPAGRVVAVGGEAEGVAVDGTTHLAAVGVRSPNGLALVDTRTGRLVRTVPLPGHVRHLATRGSQVLVPVEDAGRLLVVDLSSGSVSQDVPTDGYPHGVSAVGTDGALVGNERGRRVSLIRGGAVVATATGFPQPGGSVVTDEGLYVVDVSSWRLTRLDLALHVGPSAAAGQGPTHAVADLQGNVVVADTRGDAVLVFSPDLMQRRRISLPGRPYGLAYDPVRDAVYVTLTAVNELVALSGADRSETGRWPTVRQPNTVGVDPATGTVVIASRTDGTLELIDP